MQYGDNRVVCGVHHPIDVEEGRRIAIDYLDALRGRASFEADFAAAKLEIDQLGK